MCQNRHILFFWSGLLDSNQRPRAPQTCALPTALNPDPFCLATDLIGSFAGAKLQSFCDSCKKKSRFFLENLLFLHFQGSKSRLEGVQRGLFRDF